MHGANRRVAQLKPDNPHTTGETRIIDYLNRNLIVLLGDPGSGKSYSFEHMARAEDAPIYSIQRFLARNGDSEAHTVYLDGLDEYRPRTIGRDSNPMVALLQLLRKTGSPRLRLACRSADWLGSTDLELFNDYQGDYVVLQLLPLEPQEAADVLMNNRVANPEQFLSESTDRHMEWTVSNPQSLLMLAEVVNRRGWPKSRRELYEKWCEIQLEEAKIGLQTSQLGHYPAADLIYPAGAACAALMISDAILIHLGPSLDDRFPSYQSVPWQDRDAVLAALSRRVFRSRLPGEAEYSHRTVAEYLAARYLGKRVAEGLPLSRVQALIGVDSHPAASLRGLHAWLPLFAPAHAAALIVHDPLGILLYGDAASLPGSHKVSLIKGLSRLAEEDAWFLKENPSDYGLAGLSCPETANDLITILDSPDQDAIRTLVLRTIRIGEPLLAYRRSLECILVNPSAPFAHRRLALQCLLRYGPDGDAAVVRAYASSIAAEKESIGLRSEIVVSLYRKPFGIAEALSVLEDAAVLRSRPTGELWPLVRGVPTADLLDLLEEHDQRRVASKPYDPASENWDVLTSVERMVGRLFEETPQDDEPCILRLIKLTERMAGWTPSAFRGLVHTDQILAGGLGLFQAG